MDNKFCYNDWDYYLLSINILRTLYIGTNQAMYTSSNNK